jgi:predicted FMN-binding regulatory protein PaiB
MPRASRTSAPRSSRSTGASSAIASALSVVAPGRERPPPGERYCKLDRYLHSADPCHGAMARVNHPAITAALRRPPAEPATCMARRQPDHAEAHLGRSLHGDQRSRSASMVDVRRLIREHGWAVLVTAAGGILQAAHVPCLLDRDRDLGGDAEQLVIVGHTARADPVSAALRAGNESLLIFQGAHGYVSPAWYGEGTYLPADVELHDRARSRNSAAARGERGVLGNRENRGTLRGGPRRPLEVAGRRARVCASDSNGNLSLPPSICDVRARAKLSQTSRARSSSGWSRRSGSRARTRTARSHPRWQP